MKNFFKKGISDHLLGLIILVIMVLVVSYIVFLGVRTVNTSNSCEANKGTCQGACLPDQTRVAFSCEQNQICCLSADAFSSNGGSGSSGPGSGASVGTILAAGHKMFVYTGSDDNIQSVTQAAATLSLSQSPQQEEYFFAAEGDKVGVCYASLMYKQKASDPSKSVVKQNGNEVRLRLSRQDCLLSATTRAPLTFNLADPSLQSYDQLFLEFIVFDKKWGETVADFQSAGSEPWVKDSEWVGAFSKPISIKKSCSLHDANKDACIADPACIHCPAKGGSCLDPNDYDNGVTGSSNAKNLACDLGCLSELSGSSNPVEYKIAADTQQCINDLWPTHFCNNPADAPATILSSPPKDGVHALYCMDLDNDPTLTKIPDNYCGCNSFKFYIAKDGKCQTEFYDLDTAPLTVYNLPFSNTHRHNFDERIAIDAIAEVAGGQEGHWDICVDMFSNDYNDGYSQLDPLHVIDCYYRPGVETCALP